VTKRAIVLYLHAHQPFRIGHFSTFDIGENKNYFDEPNDMRANNRAVLDKVIQKSYIPTNRKLLELIQQHPEFKISLSITGTLIEQLEKWSPLTLESFKELVATDKVEIVGETYHHSLAFFYSLAEFNNQVQMHRDKIWEVFGKKPTVFRNTELSYNNDLAVWADRAGYKAVLAEGWDPILQWRSPNYVYRPVGTQTLKLLLKNYKLSDDIAFRFGDQNWESWPLTADKYAHWLNAIDNGTNINLFMDYETFGEHQWKESGIFDFLSHFPGEWLKNENNTFMTASEAVDSYDAVDTIDTPYTTTWADTERDLSAWLGNPMQQQAIEALYGLSEKILSSNDWALIEDWRKLQTSDHFYYMCTKWFNDGDIHAYFSPYDSPYIAFMNFMNTWHDLRYRLTEKGLDT
jgi:alpha-amylase